MKHLSPELLAELNAGIAKHQLESVGDEIRKNAAECLALVATGEDDYSSVGNTRLGGDPDLPEGVEWPVDADAEVRRYPNFIGQINFAEIPRLPNDDVLPKSGLLSLFVRYMDSAAEPVLLDGVFFDGDLSRLRRRRSPPNESLCDEYLVDLVP
jgi:hypothetical protein